VKFGLFYQLPCAPDQSEPVRYQETIDQIILADELGFDIAWLAELHFFRAFSIMPGPLYLATAIAQRTKRIRFGTGVTLLPFHHPLRIAEEAAVVDILTGGRLDFGIAAVLSRSISRATTCRVMTAGRASRKRSR